MILTNKNVKFTLSLANVKDVNVLGRAIKQVFTALKCNVAAFVCMITKQVAEWYIFMVNVQQIRNLSSHG